MENCENIAITKKTSSKLALKFEIVGENILIRKM